MDNVLKEEEERYKQRRRKVRRRFWDYNEVWHDCKALVVETEATKTYTSLTVSKLVTLISGMLKGSSTEVLYQREFQRTYISPWPSHVFD